MSYAVPIAEFAEQDQVGVGISVVYQHSAHAGTIAYDLVTPVIWDLLPNPKVTAKLLPYLTSLGNLTVDLEEITNPLRDVGETQFELLDKSIMLKGGASRLVDLIDQRLAGMVEAAVKLAAAALAPLFGPFLVDIAKAVFSPGPPPSAPRTSSKRVRIEALPWWGPNLWHHRPGALALRFRIGYVISSLPASSKPVRLKGVARYRLRLVAETGKWLGKIQPTGRIQTKPIEFEVSWK